MPRNRHGHLSTFLGCYSRQCEGGFHTTRYAKCKSNDSCSEGPARVFAMGIYVLAWLAMFAYAEDTGRNRAKSSNREFSSPLAPKARDGSAAARS